MSSIRVLEVGFVEEYFLFHINFQKLVLLNSVPASGGKVLLFMKWVISIQMVESSREELLGSWESGWTRFAFHELVFLWNFLSRNCSDFALCFSVAFTGLFYNLSVKTIR